MSLHFLGNSVTLENVFIASSGTVCGPLEYLGPLGSDFDKSIQDYHYGEKSFEKAERKMLRDALDICLKRERLKYHDVDLYLGSDLLNQAIDAGELSKETPVKQLSDAIVSQYYGIVLTWGILNGASAPVELLKKYCQGQLRDSLSHYQI